MTWPARKLGEIYEENIKSPFKVGDADNIGNYLFFTSGGNILKHSKFLVDGEIIFLSTGGYAHVKYYNGKASYSTDTWSLKVKNALTKFVYYQILGRIKFIDVILFRGTGLRHLQKKGFFNLEISLPPFPIQQKIVKILDTIQSAIEIQEKIIEKTKELKKSLMADLFKYGGLSFRKGRKSKKTEIGETPEDWGVARLGDGDLFEIKLGGTPKTNIAKYWNGNINWITPNDLSKLSSIYIEETERRISDEGLRNGSKLLKEGSIILSTRAPIGYVAVLSKLMTFNQGCKGIEIKDRNKIHNIFLYYFLIKNSFRLNELGAGSTFRELSTGDLKNFKIPLPSFPEQRAIAEILQAIDQKIEVEQKKKVLYEELFKTMLNKIMKQEIDVEKMKI